MKRLNDTPLQLIVIVAIAVAVCILGVLQYHWTSEISTVEQERLKTVLAKSVRNFDRQFAYDFERLGESFEIDPAEPASTIDARLSQKYLDWSRATSRPELISGVYLWRKDKSRRPYVESLDRTKLQFQSSAGPSDIEALQPDLEKQFGLIPPSMAGHEAIYYPWKFYGDKLALVRPLFQIISQALDSDMGVEPIGFLVVRIDGHSLKSRYLADLIENDFAPAGFMVAIRSASPPYSAIYLSDPAFPIATTSPDAELNLFKSVDEEARRRGHPAMEPDDQSRQWQLVAQHPSGSLEGAVARWRRRNLAISLALLGILLSCAGLIFSLSRRAERLSKLQMQFVAGVSHELCTPLTVINSAIENLADGIVDDPTQVQEYAAILRDQGGRLSRLLDQVLLLASGKLKQTASELRPVEVAAVVTHTLTTFEKMLRDEGFTLQKEIAMDVPPIMADPVLFSECIANLISNAMKYGGPNRWIALRIREVKARSLHEVQISVEDRGIGIVSGDLQNIFEPFYRVQAVRDGQVRGVGLGLYLVKRMIESMGGRISVSSALGRGSCFVLHFSVMGLVKDQLARHLSSPSTTG